MTPALRTRHAVTITGPGLVSGRLMSRILCLSFSDLHADPRVRRQITLDFRSTSLACALSPLTPESLARLKENARRAADVLFWERESEKLLTLTHRLLA